MNVRGPFVCILVFHTWSLFIYVEKDSKDKLQYSMYFVAGFDRAMILYNTRFNMIEKYRVKVIGLKLVGFIQNS